MKQARSPVSRPTRIALKVAVWGGCLAPLALLGHRAWADELGANPVSFVTNTLGDWTLRILLASLAMTPLRIVFGLAWPITLRRLLGLFAFAYACLHFSVWIVLDFFFEWPRLHRLVYVTGVCAVLHYLWLAKVGVTAPYWYAGVLAVLLGVRGWDRGRRLVRRRRRAAVTATSAPAGS